MFQAIIAGVGLGLSAFSAFKGNDAAEDQQKATQRGYDAQQKIADSEALLSREVSGITQRQENVRRKITELESIRARRALIREAQLARATAISRSSTTGASLGSSSIQGVMGNLASQQAGQLNEIRANAGSAATMFRLNAEITAAQNRNAERTSVFGKELAGAQQAAAAAGSNVNFYSTLGQVGGNLTQNADTISNVGQSFGGLFKR